jgi:hypothetical protein
VAGRWGRRNSFFYTLSSFSESCAVSEICTHRPSPAHESAATSTQKRRFAVRQRIHWLVADRPEQARADVDAAMQAWTPVDFTLQHLWAVWAKADIALYTGDANAAFAALAERSGEVQRSKLLRIQSIRLRWWEALARAALATADAPQRVRRAALLGRRLSGARTNLSEMYARLINAAVAHIRGDGEGAVLLLVEAEERAIAIDMKLHAAVARRRRGQLLGDDGGRALLEATDEWMASQGVRSAERLSAMLLPGFDRQVGG